MPLGGVIFITIFIAFFGAFLLWLASKTGGPAKKTTVKMEPYECGIPAVDKKDTKISVKFYLTAILFILFDIEIIFMYPWAVTFKDLLAGGLGGFAIAEMGTFMVVFIFGLVWAIKSKALEWD